MKLIINQRVKFCIGLSITFLMCSCAAFFYAPNPLNMPLPHDKKEAKFKAYTGLNESGVQASYSIINHLLIHADGSFYDHIGPYGSSSRTAIDGGFGFYQPIEKNGCFEILGGYGNGSAIGGYTSSQLILIGPPENEISNLKGSYQKLFVQPDIGFSRHNFDLGLGFRYAIIYPHNLQYTENYVNANTQKLYYGFYGSYNKNRIYVIEPCLNLGFGEGPFKVFMSGGWSTFQAGSPGNGLLNKLFLNYFISIGVTFHLNRYWEE